MDGCGSVDAAAAAADVEVDDGIINGVQQEDDANPPLKQMLREYQKVLVEIAKQRNTIACLPTGAGKTLIAIKLMLHYRDKVKGGQKIVFLVNTVALLVQQANAIRAETGYRVLEISGKTSRWKKDDAINSCDVLVAIPAIFQEALDSNVINFERLCLIVIDECHHSVKLHPYNTVMAGYRTKMKEGVKYQMPRILGLSATLVIKNTEIYLMDLDIKNMENTLCSTAVTYEAYEEVLKFSTKAEIVVKPYESRYIEEDHWASAFAICKEVLNKKITTLQRFPLSKDRAKKMVQMNRVKMETDAYREIINAITDMETAFLEIGAFGAMIVAHMKLVYFKSLDESQICKCAATRTLFLTTINVYIFRMREYVEKFNGSNFLKSCSKKVQQLFYILQHVKSRKSTFCGIIFVERRVEAYALGAVIDQMIQLCPDDWGYLKSEIIIGLGNTDQIPSRYRQSLNLQSKAMDRFRAGVTNLLIATKVLQEGIDIQACNFVLRFDVATSYQSFIQSMGRARGIDATFFVMTPKLMEAEYKESICKFLNLQQVMTEKLKQQAGMLENAITDCVLGELGEDGYHKMINDMAFRPGSTVTVGSDSPAITIFRAITLINQYNCLIEEAKSSNGKEMIPSSNLERSVKVLSLEEAVSGRNNDPDENYYRGFLRLPLIDGTFTILEGPVMKGRGNAKKAVYLEGCKMLYNYGVLDDHLKVTDSSFRKAVANFKTKESLII